MSCKHVGPTPLVDLTTLAAQIVEGIQVHLSDKFQPDLERLLKEQEQRLLAALLPECSSRRTDANSAAAARILGPTRRRNTGSSVPSTSSTSARLPLSSQKLMATRTPTDENLYLEVRSSSKKSQGQCLTPSKKSEAGKSEKRWLKLPWPHLNSDAPQGPSGMRSLEEARDSELLAVVPDLEARGQQPPSRAESFSKAMLTNRKEEQVLTFSLDNSGAGPSGVVWTSVLNEKPSPEDDQLDKARSPEERAPAAAAASMAVEFHPPGSLPKGRTADVAGAASASSVSTCQLTYEQIIADLKHHGDLPTRPVAACEACSPRTTPKHRHQPKRFQDGWAAGATPGTASGGRRQSPSQAAHKLGGCSPRQRSSLTTAASLEDSRETVVMPMVRQTTTQSISTVSSDVSMQSFPAPPEPLLARPVHERVCTGGLDVEPAKPGFRRSLDAEHSASDTKALCLNRKQELPGDGANLPDLAAAPKQEGEMEKLASGRGLFASNISSNTRAVRLKREEELLSGIGPCGARAQDRIDAVPAKQGISRVFQGRAYGSDTKLPRLKQEEWLMGESSKPSPRHRQSSRVLEQVAPEQIHPSLRRRRLSPKAFSSDTTAVQIKQEEEFRDEIYRQSKASKQEFSPQQNVEPAKSTQMVWCKQGGPENDVMSSEVPTLFEEKPSLRGSSVPCRCEMSCGPVQRYFRQRVDSPLLLRLCGLLPWGRLQVAHQRVMQLLTAILVAIFAEQFYRGQARIMSTADCPGGFCMHLGHLSDLVLSMSSLLGLLAMRTLASLNLLGSGTALLARFAVENDAVQKWSRATFWNSVYLTILWIGSLAFRAATMPSEAHWLDMVRVWAFTLTSLIFMTLVFSILHVSCIICILVDIYAMKVSKSMDPVRSIQEWDRLGALLRKVSRAVDRGLLLVQIAAIAMLLCSFTDLMLHGEERIWQFLSNVVLAQSLILPVSKAAEATEMCTRLPSLINGMDFEGNDFSLERHYLVEHISYSAAGFYVGEIRLTASIALRATYVSIIVALGVLTKLTQLAIV